MDDVLSYLTPYLREALASLVVAAVSFAVAWLRARTQRLVVQQATDEVETAAHRDPLLRGSAKRELAIDLANERLSAVNRPTARRMERLLDQAVPVSQSSFPPPTSGADG